MPKKSKQSFFGSFSNERFSLLAGSIAATVQPAPVVATPIILDTTRAPTGYVYSESDRKAVNATSGANQLSKWAIAATAIPSDGTIRYWEIAAAAGLATYNGYMGVVSVANREAGKGAGTSSPVAGDAIGYRGNSEIWSGGIRTNVATTGFSWGAGDIVMLAFNPATGRFWCGKNGQWMVTQPPNTTMPWVTITPGTYYPYVQGRDTNEGGTLRSLASQFTYPAPTGTLPLGA